MSEISIATLETYRGLIVSELLVKLRQSRLELVMSGAGTITGIADLDFGTRFGWGLEKVGIADIAALVLYLEPAPTLEEALGNLYGHIRSAPDGKTGLSYFDDWTPADDYVSNGAAEVWSHESPGRTREFLKDGYRIRQSWRDASGNPGVFVTVFFKRVEG